MDDRDYQICRENWYREIVKLVQEGDSEELMLNDLIRIRRCTDDFVNHFFKVTGELPSYGNVFETCFSTIPLESYGYNLPRVRRYIEEETELFEELAKKGVKKVVGKALGDRR